MVFQKALDKFQVFFYVLILILIIFLPVPGEAPGEGREGGRKLRPPPEFSRPSPAPTVGDGRTVRAPGSLRRAAGRGGVSPRYYVPYIVVWFFLFFVKRY